MKKLFYGLFLLVGFTASSQNFQGIAVYESKYVVDFERLSKKGNKIDDAEKERLNNASMSTYTLYFDKVSSYYEQEAKLEEPVNMLDEHIMVSTVNTDKLYKNIKDKVSLLQKESMNKDYLISDSLRKWDWKLENETKKIGNYTCYKAIATYTVKDQSFTFTNMSKKEMKENDIDEKTANVIKDVVIEKTVTAWYTPDIPVSHGPGDYWGLPGLILEVTEGKITLMCSKITLNPKKKFEVKVPRKGEKITKADYEVLSKKKLEEMMEMMQQNNKG